MRALVPFPQICPPAVVALGTDRSRSRTSRRANVAAPVAAPVTASRAERLDSRNAAPRVSVAAAHIAASNPTFDAEHLTAFIAALEVRAQRRARRQPRRRASTSERLDSGNAASRAALEASVFSTEFMDKVDRLAEKRELEPNTAVAIADACLELCVRPLR